MSNILLHAFPLLQVENHYDLKISSDFLYFFMRKNHTKTPRIWLLLKLSKTIRSMFFFQTCLMRERIAVSIQLSGMSPPRIAWNMFCFLSKLNLLKTNLLHSRSIPRRSEQSETRFSGMKQLIGQRITLQKIYGFWLANDFFRVRCALIRVGSGKFVMVPRIGYKVLFAYWIGLQIKFLASWVCFPHTVGSSYPRLNKYFDWFFKATSVKASIKIIGLWVRKV